MVAVGLGLVAAAAVLLLARTPPLQQLERWSYDWRVAVRSLPALAGLQAPSHHRNPNVVVVPIDQRTLDRLPEPMVFWAPHFAAVVEELAAAGAVAGIDYLFTLSPDDYLQQRARQALEALASEGQLGADPESVAGRLPRSDLELFAALRKGRAVLACFLREDGTVERGYLPFAYAAGLPNLGLVNSEPDADGVVRHHFLYKTGRAGEREVALLPLALVVARNLLGAPVAFDAERRALWLGDTVLPGDQDFRVVVNYAGPPGTFMSRYSFGDLVERARAGDHDFFSSEFGGKAVLIGPWHTGSGDFVRTPYSVRAAWEMPGVEVHANILNTIVNRDFVAPAPAWLGPALVVGAALLAALLSFSMRPLWATLLLAAVALTLAGASFLALARFNRWLELAAPLATLPLGFALVFTFRYATEARERRHVRDLLGRYVSESVAREILRDGSSLALGGRRTDVSVLFCDIDSFTPLAARSSPEQVIALLNDYFTRMERVIFAHRGTLKQFVGDEIMVICGAPEPDPDNAVTACRLALAMVAALREWQQERQAAGLESFEVKLGLHCGEVVVGNVGSPHRAEYAAVGDVVNTGSRIMGLCPTAGARVLISEDMHFRVGDRFATRDRGSFPVKGKEGELRVYELVCDGGAGVAAPTAETG